MQLYRIVQEKYADKLFASGRQNRWNKRDEFVIYTGQHRSLAALELLVHQSSIQHSEAYVMLIIAVNAKATSKKIPLTKLPDNWRSMFAYPTLQEIGSDWYHAEEHLLLQVPSAVIPQESNLVINTKHPDFKKHVRITKREPFLWDRRLT